MTMDADKRIAFLESQLQSLSKEKEAALLALHAAAGMGHFETSYSRLASPEPILREAASRVRDMLRLALVSLYLVDEETHDLALGYRQGQAPDHDPEACLDTLIAEQSVAWAMGRNTPTFFSTPDASGQLLLHPIISPSRTRGLFVGLLAEDKRTISDTSLALFTVVMNATAHALESFELYRRFAAINQGLERKVRDRTEELSQAYEQVRVILDSIQAGVVVIDPESHVVEDINPAGRRMIGLPREEIVGRTCFASFCPTSQGNCPVTDHGRAYASEERILCTGDGRRTPILKTSVLATLRGKPYIIESFVDISEQHKLAQLREDVERMTRHDLKSPLVGIIGLPDVLLANPELDEDSREILEIIKDSGHKMLKMINMSLDLYKMETGTYQLRPVPVDIKAVLGAVLDSLSDLVDVRELTVERTRDGDPLDEDPFLVPGEELLYYSLFSNLLKNAIEASPDGGEIRLALFSSGPATVALSNQGAIPADMRERFFQKYATSGKDGGTGLGAYGARLIVENLGGRIWFETSEERGTTIFLSLPRPDAPEAGAAGA